LNVPHRRRKAEKIARIVQSQRSLGGLDLLEIGCGSGVISRDLAERVGPSGSVTAVDVLDERVVTDGFAFELVDGVMLPFADDRFDLIVTNHVIEHVGDRGQQRTHLREIARVLRPKGLCYLAVPNRWALREPHFGLWFLSWLPHTMRHVYVRAASKGDIFDCEPPGPLTIRRLIRDAGLELQEVTDQAMRLVLELENGPGPARIARAVPRSLLRLISPVSPTMVFLLSLSSCTKNDRQ
jgi:ubiquinone/menaquinone biosynthesis C-methylase UbiE